MQTGAGEECGVVLERSDIEAKEESGEGWEVRVQTVGVGIYM